MPKEINRKTISDAQLQFELVKLFNKGNTSNTNIYELLRTRYKLMKQRYIEIYHSTLKEWQKTKGKAHSEQIYENEKESLKSGLKSKIVRQIELQKMLEPDYLIEDTYIYKGKPLKYHRNLTPLERKMYYELLMKSEGDLITKAELTGKDGKDLMPEDFKIVIKKKNATN